MRLRNTSVSRKNFASLLVRRIFNIEERATSNVNGRNKSKLDPLRVEFVKHKVLQMYPLLPAVLRRLGLSV